MGPILLTLITEFLEKRDKQITVKMKMCPQSSSGVSFRERHAILSRYTELSITPAVLNFSLHRTSRGREGCAAFTISRKANASYLIWVLCDLWVQKEAEVKYTLKTGPILTILCTCSSHTYHICPLCNFGFAQGKDAVHVNNSSWY